MFQESDRAAQRIYVHETVYDDFVARFVDVVQVSYPCSLHECTSLIRVPDV
jgi:acyl-CoA reductase-like NAD-dependent aldehyde dehydrogenase